MHTPLVKYGKKVRTYKNRYKYFNFVKLSLIADNSAQIITYIDTYLQSSQYPVFLFTYADLMDLSEAILCLLGYRPDCTLLFVPESNMITAGEFLMEMQANYIKNGQLGTSVPLGYSFLSYCIHYLQSVMRIPVVTINL